METLFHLVSAGGQIPWSGLMRMLVRVISRKINVGALGGWLRRRAGVHGGQGLVSGGIGFLVVILSLH